MTSPSFPLRTYLQLLIELDELLASGQEDSPRIDVVVDAMDAPWNAMSDGEQALARKVSAALGDAWVGP